MYRIAGILTYGSQIEKDQPTQLQCPNRQILYVALHRLHLVLTHRNMIPSEAVVLNSRAFILTCDLILIPDVWAWLTRVWDAERRIFSL